MQKIEKMCESTCTRVAYFSLNHEPRIRIRVYSTDLKKNESATVFFLKISSLIFVQTSTMYKKLTIICLYV